jgi:amino acid transporter
MIKLNRRGKRVRAIVIYVLILTAIYILSAALGVWDIPESCLVDGIGCPDGYRGR